MILITMALSLVACSGSSGSDGASGAAGADGTIAVPSADSDLAITASATLDADLTLGQVDREYTVSGTDNLSADNRTRYYAYFGSSATSKDFVAETDDNKITWSACLGLHASTTGPLDTRLKSADNCTAALGAGDAIGAGAGATQYMIICPGNEAGDATSCASADLGDRGWGARGARRGDPRPINVRSHHPGRRGGAAGGHRVLGCWRAQVPAHLSRPRLPKDGALLDVR